MVPKKFHRWLKVFGKVESERMPTRKVWDHAIDLKEEFKASKAKVYPLSRNEREEVQNFKQTSKEGLYQAYQVTADIAGILCGEKGWRKTHGYGLPQTE